MTDFPRLRTRRLFRVVNGGTPRADEEFWNGDVAWATPIDLGAAHGETFSSTERTLTRAGLEAGSRSVPSGSLILSTRAPIGYVSEAGTIMAFNQGCRGLVPRQELDSRYYRYTFVALSDELASFGQGSTFTELPSDSLAEFRIPAPSVAQQRAIADYLDAETARIDALIEKKHRIASTIEERFRSDRDRWVQELMVTHGSTTVRRLVDGVEQGWSPSCENRIADPDEWGVLKTSAVTQEIFKGEENKRLPDDIQPDLRWIVKDNDVLIARGSGSIKRVGIAAVATTGERSLMISDLIYRLVQPRMKPTLLTHCINSTVGRTHLESSVRTDVGQTLKIRGDDLLDTPVPWVPPERQDEALSEVESTRYIAKRTIDKIRTQLALLSEHRQALVTAAVMGQLEIPEAKHETGRTRI